MLLVHQNALFSFGAQYNDTRAPAFHRTIRSSTCVHVFQAGVLFIEAPWLIFIFKILGKDNWASFST